TTRAVVTSTSSAASASAGHRPSPDLVGRSRRAISSAVPPSCEDARVPRRLPSLALALAFAACASGSRRAPMHPESPPGSWYVVAPGGTLAEIATRAGVPAEDILELNGIARAADVTPGRLIFVLEGPGGRPPPPPAPTDDDGSPPLAMSTSRVTTA